MNIENEKKEFLHREFCAMCFMAGLGMAQNSPPVYKKGANREAVKDFLREEPRLLQGIYNEKKVDTDRHIENIEKIREELKKSMASTLQEE